VDRANQLKDFLNRESPHEPVHLFAHSMGGLDCRYLISILGMADRVLSLTTLGAPHRGSCFADWGMERFGRVLRPFFDFLHLPYGAFCDLTVDHCQKFNELTPNAPGVRYFSVAGRFRSNWLAPTWQLSGRIIQQVEGDNDGAVSVASARYGESCEIWEGDHMNLVNWVHGWTPFRLQCDRIPHYAGLVRRLADEGF
jgi:triacylglycerol lipase